MRAKAKKKSEPKRVTTMKSKSLLVILNNCKYINENAHLPKIDYTDKKYLRFKVSEDMNVGEEKIKNKKLKKNRGDFNYENGLPIKLILGCLYGGLERKKKYSGSARNNVNDRIETLISEGILKKIGSSKPFSYCLKSNDVETFKKIITLLIEERQIGKLAYTEYFNKDGVFHFNALFSKIPEGFRDIDITDPVQQLKYQEYIYGRLTRSPTFLSILISDNLNERLASLQNALDTSYIRQQGVKNNFPYLQSLGTYCMIIDYLHGDTNLIQDELVECLNDTERLIYTMWKDEPKFPDLSNIPSETKVKKTSKSKTRRRHTAGLTKK